jgi:hypothetical protein
MHWYNKVLGNQPGVYNEPKAIFSMGLLTNWHDSHGDNVVVYVLIQV